MIPCSEIELLRKKHDSVCSDGVFFVKLLIVHHENLFKYPKFFHYAIFTNYPLTENTYFAKIYDKIIGL